VYYVVRKENSHVMKQITPTNEQIVCPTSSFIQHLFRPI